jgi:hypothetical protein
METSFVISLGITFVLLLLLIYHFKQRLSVTESKQDTMFEIINNLAQELNNMKMGLSLMNRPSTPYPHNIVGENISNGDINVFEQMEKLVNEDSDDEDSDDEDSDDEDSDDEDSDDEDSDDEDEKIIVSDEEDQDDNISVEEIRPSENIENSAEELVIDILENIQTNTQEPESLDTSNSQEVDIVGETEPQDFSKMNLGALKTYIIQQGWVDDASKMKKAQILSLIQEHQ